ncbi:AraC family transcriptional regulator [Mycolicibacterium boenickei]|uniref:AraC family transcriptional regulator n=2 Tax=Mycolicibacterium boenickei TaxID=146017 RepID=A0AAX3A5T6_9MYCO|nr:AraC family transcriptional regulator [Mycolicibacterium boenickei]UNC02851.1 AraC family transcriptional regulator [Mycolicibacterium boenickei]BBX91226.1 AraC family transcriptional regulator [Mycolicibacterium boenickei]
MAGFRDRATDLVELPIVPRPAVTVVFEFGDCVLAVDDNAGRQQWGSLVAGPGPCAVRVQTRSAACVEVLVSPVLATAVLGVSPAELDNNVVVLDDLWGREASRMRQQLTDARSWGDRFELTEALISKRLGLGPAADPQVVWAWNRMLACRGQIRVERLAAELEWSRKRLWSRFRHQIGLSPKRAAALIRFDHAARRLMNGETPARVAVECGYVDQSHFHRDALSFTGMTPTSLARSPGSAIDRIAYPQ